MMKKTLLFLCGLLGLNHLCSQQAHDILALHTNLLGGESKLFLLNTIRMKGILKEAEGDHKLTISILQGEAYKMEYTKAKRPHILLVTKNSGEILAPSKGTSEAQPLSEEEIRTYQPKLNIPGELFYAKKNNLELRLSDMEQLNDRSCYVLVTRLGTPPRIKKHYLDQQTLFLIQEVEYSPEDHDASQSGTTVKYFDYQKTPEGYIFPRRIQYPDHELIFESIEINPKLTLHDFQGHSTKSK